MTDHLKAADAWADANAVRYSHLHRVTLGDPYTPAGNARRAQDSDAIAAVQAGVAMVSPGYPLGALHALQTSDEDALVRHYDGAHAVSELCEDGEPRRQSIPEGFVIALVTVGSIVAAVLAVNFWLVL